MRIGYEKDMIEIWEDFFLSEIEKYEEMEFIINPFWKINSKIALYWLRDIKEVVPLFYLISDYFYKLGFRKIVIETLSYHEDNKISINFEILKE